MSYVLIDKKNDLDMGFTGYFLPVTGLTQFKLQERF